MGLVFVLISCCCVLLSCGVGVVVSTSAECAANPHLTSPTECTNLQVDGIVTKTGDPTSYIWCEATTNKGVVVKCTPDGYVYNEDIPACVPPQYNAATTKCKNLPNTWTCTTNFNVGTVCTLTCDTGYAPSDGGNGMVTCLQGSNTHAKWDKPIPTCKSKCVPNPCVQGTCALQGGNAQCTCTAGWEGPTCTKVKFMCGSKNCGNKGYCINNINDPKCECVAGYEGSTCADKVQCPDPTAAVKGTIAPTASKYEFEDKVKVTCATGKYVSGKAATSKTQDIQCGADKKWTPNIECLPVDCGQPKIPPESGSATATATVYDSTADLRCQVGYSIPTLSGANSGTLKCQDNGEWGTAVCQPHNCQALTAPANALSVTQPVTTFGKSATITCSVGYIVKDTTSNTGSVICKLPGTGTNAAGWADFPGCVEKVCDGPPVPTSPTGLTNIGSLNYNGNSSPYKYNNEVTLQCQANYKVNGGDANKKLKCSYTGWVPMTVTPSCTPLKCNIAFGTGFANGDVVFSNSDNVGTKATITCKPGYIIDSTTTTTKDLTCSANSQQDDTVWSPSSIPSCNKRSCPGLNNPTHGSWSVNAGSFGDKAKLTCNTNYFPYPQNGNDVACGPAGKWLPDPATCNVKSCDPVEITNGNVKLKSNNNVVTGSIPVNEQIYFVCDNGFKLSKEVTLTCQDQPSLSVGKYSDDAPTCQNEDNCVVNKVPVNCGANGNCKDGVAKYVCECNPGWTNVDVNDKTSLCTTPVDPCQNQPCKNNGACTLNTAYTTDSNLYPYKCDCNPSTRFSGYDCEKDNQISAPAKCSDVGSQPHPGSCLKFYTCQWGNSQVQSCPPNNVFDSTISNCQVPLLAKAASKCTANNNL